ncbi:MAG TPA: hypothetical protein VM840_03370 [Actinomycetota bacterium]|nr:hypothetical protein [Actinomycetota bacterium]
MHRLHLLRRAATLVAATTILFTATAAAGVRGREVVDRPTGGTAAALLSGGAEHVASIPYSGGSDLEFATIGGRDYVFAGRVNSYIRGIDDLRHHMPIVDVTKPGEPVVVSVIPCTLYQGDVQLFHHANGRVTLVLAQDDAGSGICEYKPGAEIEIPPGFVTFDVTDPRRPRFLGRARVPTGAHNTTVHPTEPLVYVSNSDLRVSTAVIHIWDISDPARPRLVQDWPYLPASPPHDITFNTGRVERSDGTVLEPGHRAYAAALTHTDVIDTTDPRNPRLISTIAHPELSLSHQADPTPDGEYLLVSDELGGGTLWPVCPGGGVHVYRIGPEPQLEAAPVKVGAFWADDLGLNHPRGTFPASCTSHVFRINPDGRTMAIAWYSAGVHVIDFRGMLEELDGTGVRAGSRTMAAAKLSRAETWAAKMWQDRHPGFVFANDMGRGLDIFYVPSCDPTCIAAS